MEVAGHEGVLFQYDSPEPDSTVLWLDGDHSLELRAPVPRDEMRTLAGSVVAVDANTWLDALPPEVVRADGRATAVAGMVADIPLPPGFDLRSLQEGDLAGDRYDLGVEVTQAITCAWIREWEAATAAGNAAQADAAEAALATAPDWAILHEMDSEGGWSDYVREWAAGAAGTGSTPHGQPIGNFCTNR